MSTKSSAATIMTWNWVVQSLAKFNQVDPSALVGVVKKAPDNLGKDARDMVSLLMLESLFINGNESTNDTDSAQNAKISLDPSEHCEDVLRNILDETSEPMTEVKQTKWNVRPFIMHKRSSLPKSPLEKLKEALLEGSHPLLLSLKERSTLGAANTSENTIPVADDDFGDQTTLAKDDLLSPNPAKENNKLQEILLQQESNEEETNTRGILEHDGRKEHELSIETPLKCLDKNTFKNHDENVPKDTNQEGQVKMVSTDGIRNSEFGECRDPKDHILPNVSTSGPSGEGKNSKENGSQLEAGTDSDVSVDEWSDIAAKKEAFLSSQCSLSQDFMAVNDYAEICLCVKCNKGGQLLVCKSGACPIRVHESCLSSAPTLDENGNFFCPFCAYSRAISKYQEVKKRTSLARISLQAFLSSQVKYTTKRACVRNEENETLAGAKEVSVEDPKSTEAGDMGKKAGEAFQSPTTNSHHQPTRQLRARKRQFNDNETLDGAKEVSIGDQRSTEAGDMGKKADEVSQSPTTDSHNQPTRQLRMHKRKFNEEQSHVSAVSSHSRRSIKHKPQYTSPRIPLIGRKKLPWTKSEEEILKEGVERLSSADSKGIPWKEILEFGRDIFDKSRTTIDLKDKWRNMNKKACH